MAKGDVRSSSSSSGGGRRSNSWGSTRTQTYNDEGRGQSLSVWEYFRCGVEDKGDAGKAWMFSIPDADCWRLIRYSTYRFGLMDICRRWDPDEYTAEKLVEYVTNDDSRAKRLVDHQYGGIIWLDVYKYLYTGYKNHENAEADKRKAKAEQWSAEWKREAEERKALAAKVAEEDALSLAKPIELATGAIRADFANAFGYQDVYGQVEGDWLDDPVDGYSSGMGFGIERRQPHSIKLQISVALDLSNSMYYNGIHMVAAQAFREIGMALKQIQGEYPNDLFLSFLTFSEDAWDKPGRKAGLLSTDSVSGFNEFETFRPSKMEGWRGRGPFQGEDTYITPLFDAIETWEKENSDVGAVKLDLVITDAVLEHAQDIRDASKTQDRRDGALSTVLLNFMPQADWLDSSLPRHCVQYSVNKDNISGILRQVLSEFIAVLL